MIVEVRPNGLVDVPQIVRVPFSGLIKRRRDPEILAIGGIQKQFEKVLNFQVSALFVHQKAPGNGIACLSIICDNCVDFIPVFKPQLARPMLNCMRVWPIGSQRISDSRALRRSSASWLNLGKTSCRHSKIDANHDFWCIRGHLDFDLDVFWAMSLRVCIDRYPYCEGVPSM